jgi:hypothetical protein
MATRVTISSTSDTHVLSLTSADWYVAGAFHETEFYRSICFARGEPQVRERHAIVAAAEELLGRVRADWSVLPYQYTVEGRMLGRDDLKRKGAGLSGFHIGGEPHFIQATACQCYVQRMGTGADESGQVVGERVDVRDRKTVDTDDWGPIRILRRKLRTTVPEQLGGLLLFLRGIPDTTVQIGLDEGTHSVRELVRLAAEGDEGAEEELFERGEAAKTELLDMLASGKPRNRQGTVAWLLLTVFPSPESRAAVQHAVERETDEGRRNEFLMLLGAVPESL